MSFDTVDSKISSFPSALGMGEDYEALPDCYPLGIHMVAGSFAGVVEHSAMYPIDSVKVSNSVSKWKTYKSILSIKIWFYCPFNFI